MMISIIGSKSRFRGVETRSSTANSAVYSLGSRKSEELKLENLEILDMAVLEANTLLQSLQIPI